MSSSLAEQLKLNFPISGFTKRFKLANGRVIWRRAIVWSRSSIPSEKTPDLNVEFHVLEPLAIPVMVGREFLKRMDFLTTHLDRLVRSPYPYGVSSSLPQILHLSTPRQRLHCFIASIPAEANIDTGATINLASPEFAARSGLQIESTDQQRQSVQLADRSIISISGCIHARFNPFDQPSTKTLLPQAHIETFYVLEGLTSDVLIGRELLLEMYAFTGPDEQNNVFFNKERRDVHDDLAVIAWMEEWRTTSGLHSCQQKSRKCFLTHHTLSFLHLLTDLEIVEVKHSTFWCDGIVHHLNERERPPM